ncbi:hypothetical protein MferCBS31731_007623 [Microsporum ferrugineum]
MTDQDNSYRPRSPDFSGFPGSVPPFHDYSQHSYAAAFATPISPQASYDASPFFSPQTHHQQQYPYHQQQQQHNHQQYHQQPYIPQLYSPTDEMAPHTRSRTQAMQQPQHMLDQQQQQYQQQQQQQQQQLQQQHQQHQQKGGGGETMEQPAPAQPEEKSLGPSGGIEVKTKFPVARIKRIMQADEDVGKVAQVTPIAVSKALELFMISLVTKGAQVARDRSSKRITANHLKEAIGKDEVLDFLADIISKVPDAPAGKKHDEDGSDQNEKPKKKGSRRKKEDMDED